MTQIFVLLCDKTWLHILMQRMYDKAPHASQPTKKHKATKITHSQTITFIFINAIKSWTNKFRHMFFFFSRIPSFHRTTFSHSFLDYKYHFGKRTQCSVRYWIVVCRLFIPVVKLTSKISAIQRVFNGWSSLICIEQCFVEKCLTVRLREIIFLAAWGRPLTFLAYEQTRFNVHRFTPLV